MSNVRGEVITTRIYFVTVIIFREKFLGLWVKTRLLFRHFTEVIISFVSYLNIAQGKTED